MVTTLRTNDMLADIETRWHVQQFSLFACDFRVYVDVILNHMTRVYTQQEIGTGGSPADTVKMSYPAVPYTEDDFNQPTCPIVDEDPKHVSIIPQRYTAS